MLLFLEKRKEDEGGESMCPLARDRAGVDGGLCCPLKLDVPLQSGGQISIGT